MQWEADITWAGTGVHKGGTPKLGKADLQTAAGDLPILSSREREDLSFFWNVSKSLQGKEEEFTTLKCLWGEGHFQTLLSLASKVICSSNILEQTVQ